MSENLLSRLPKVVDDYKLESWDKGVFAFELLKLNIVPAAPLNAVLKPHIGRASAPTKSAAFATTSATETEPTNNPLEEGVTEGTFVGTQMALTEAFNLIESRFATFYDVLGLEPVLPRRDPVSEKRKLYVWESDDYPPHCKHIPDPDSVWQTQIFNNLALAEVATIIPKLTPQGSYFDWIAGKVFDPIRYKLLNKTPEKAKTLNDVWKFNVEERKLKTSAYESRNVGDRQTWYSDASFAQQQFTGTNPTTIRGINTTKGNLLAEFIEQADFQGKKDMAHLLRTADPKSLYVQDNRYFREAIGIHKDKVHEDIRCNTNAYNPDQWRYAVAAVSLFQLHTDGKLHPLAIVIDYKNTMKESVVIYNKRLQPAPTGVTPPEEETDWPWRFAKTAAQTSDWIRHEVTIHLVNTHMIEEAIIVATQRSFPWDHPVLRILYPHWYKTLSLNKAARDTLVPKVILDIVGFDTEQSFRFINHAYENFDFQGLYIPEDLKSRGFPPEKLDDEKFKNYAYARNIYPLWNEIHAFVSDMLKLWYKDDAAVASDSAIGEWIDQMRGDANGRLKSFPEEINTLADLTNVVTMCIHIASPQHTAVNYLQQYYQSFVINKPAALCARPPRTIDELNKYTEAHIMDALPLDRAREWLLMSHLPYLLSFRVNENNSLASYVASLYAVYKKKTPTKEDPHVEGIRDAAAKFYEKLVQFDINVQEISKKMDDNFFPYDVLDPDATAVSILI